MKLRIILFVLMTSMIGVSFAAKPYKSRAPERYELQQHELQQLLDAPAKLQAKPVLFYDLAKFLKNVLAFSDIQKISNDAIRLKALKELNTKKIPAVFASIANRLGACAVIPYDNYLNEYRAYIAPGYDITQEAIDQLNREYLARK
ncbi:MAG: hypothetical protein WCS92_02470 [Candidatus Babeliales bacterium]|jgi:hypothetical protein